MAKSKESQEFVMPTSPNDVKKIKDVVLELSGQLQMIDDRKQYIKEAVAALAEEFSIPKKILNDMAKTHWKQNYRDRAQENDVFAVAYETLFAGEASDND